MGSHKYIQSTSTTMSSTISSSSIGSFEHAKELLAEGKRDLLVHAIPDAVSNCSKACEMIVRHKGEMAADCAEAYFYYGKALLEPSRVESGVLGNALDGVDMETKTTDVKDALVEDTEAMTTDEKSEIEEKVADAFEENFDKHDMVARAHTGGNTEEEAEMDEVLEGEKDSDEMETDAEKADAEAGNLEQAWQMFDLAKVIYGKAGGGGFDSLSRQEGQGFACRLEVHSRDPLPAWRGAGSLYRVCQRREEFGGSRGCA